MSQEQNGAGPPSDAAEKHEVPAPAQGADEDEEPADEDITGGEAGLGDDTKKLLLRFMKNKQHTVDKDALTDMIVEKQMERDSFCRLPFTIFFFIIYVVAMLNHENVADSGLVQREMRSMLEGTTYEGVAYTSGHKDMGDIDTKEDIYNYLREAVLPLFINPITGPPENLHRSLRYNQVIGGVVLQQVRRKAVKCSSEYPNLGPFKDGSGTNPLLTNFFCYPWTSEDTSCFGPEAKRVVNGKYREGWCPDSKAFQATANSTGGRRLDYIPDGGGTGGSSKGAREPTREVLYSVNMYEYEGIDVTLAKVHELEAEGWIDFNTAWMGVQILVLNPDLAVFVHVTMSVYMPPSGAMLPKVVAQSFLPEPYQFKSVIALDVIYLLCVLFLTVGVLREIFSYARKEKCKDYLMHPWNFLDVLTVVSSYVLIILWLILYGKMDMVKEKAMATRAAEPLPGQTSEIYPSVVADLHEELRDASKFLNWWRIFLGMYTIIIAMKFLESFANQPRLAVVTNTITRAGSDLFHFGIVMATVFMSYVVAGMFLFGRRIHGFSSEPTTINTCFLMMLGDFDWEELGWEHPMTAQIWFWSYMIVMMMLMLNMLMAIIMDVYTEVKSEAADFAPVWTQLYEAGMEMYNIHRGHLISNSEMLQVLNEMPEDDVDEDILMRRAGPGLSRDQAEALIEATRVSLDNKLNKGVTMSDAMRMIGWVKIAVQKIGWQLEEILQAEAEEEELITGVSKDGSPAQGDLAGSKDSQTAYVADAAERIESIEQRMSKIDAFMQESLQYSTFRGKDLRNRLAVIEDLVRNQRDILVRDSADIWDQMPPKLDGSFSRPQRPQYPTTQNEQTTFI